MRHRVIAVVAAAAVVAVACGGGDATTTTAAASEPAATEYAISARRALEGTRFEDRSDSWLAGVVLDGCGSLVTGGDGDAALAGVIAATLAGIPPPNPIEDRILAEVVLAGVGSVCPDRVLGAITTTIAPADPVDDYLVAVGAVADEAGVFVHPDVLVDAGRSACAALEAGRGPEAALLASAEVVYGVRVDAVSELEESEGLVAADGIVLGTVLAGAVSSFCPGFADAVLGYVAVIGERP